MAVIPRTPELKAMLEQWLKDHEPTLYRQLKTSGQLAAVIEAKAEFVREMHNELKSSAMTQLLRNPKPNPMDQAAALDGVIRETWEVALGMATEFPPESLTAARP